MKASNDRILLSVVLSFKNEEPVDDVNVNFWVTWQEQKIYDQVAGI